MGKAGLSLLAFALAACAPVDGPRGTVLDQPPPPVYVPPPPPPPPEPVDFCGAKALQYLIGKHRNEIPIPVDPSGRRVTCTTCPVTMDYSPSRLNILYESSTGIIKEVKCG
ncbi:MAG TPA: hypothetical protein VF138_03495 [Caulobacteraceae bacterium]